MRMYIAALSFALWVAPTDLRGDEPNTVDSATRRGLARIVQAASDWQSHQSCFSCHHQTLPMLAAIEADRAGIPVDREWLKSQADTTLDYFRERVHDMDEGEHVPGGAATVGFGFWALNLDKRIQDETTTSMVTYLLQIQGSARLRDPKQPKTGPVPSAKKNDGHWQASCRRAPMQGSLIGDTVLVLIGIEKYATPTQREQVDAARQLAEQWLTQVPLRNQQDQLWRLWGLYQLAGGNESIKLTTLTSILAAQRDDGGWAETKERDSDSYSTGQTLFMLLKTGVDHEHPSIVRARDYLLSRQHTDGSWLAESHVSFKAQPYFDNGDPHGEHQFLSTAATAWATAGLAQLLPGQPLVDEKGVFPEP
ncbi:MAG: hypothetical protein NTW52_15085 [Planctomycetota bacterium]|nr:hypothetical protein [Planctomycetota bacterium]